MELRFLDTREEGRSVVGDAGLLASSNRGVCGKPKTVRTLTAGKGRVGQCPAVESDEGRADDEW